jgi:hypothetical protein
MTPGNLFWDHTNEIATAFFISFWHVLCIVLLRAAGGACGQSFTVSQVYLNLIN